MLGAAAVSLALGCAFALPVEAQTSGQTSGKATAGKPAAGKTPAAAPLDEVDPDERISDTVIDLAAWVIATGDNRGLPFAVVDKRAAQVLVFGENGRIRGLAPILIGSAEGDTSAEGIADRELKDIPAEDRTTPAGRYHVAFGPAAQGKTVLWVDFATAVSIHPLEATSAAKKEKRRERLASATPGDNRITHGCINVSPNFYAKVVRPAFEDEGVFYILPDTWPVRKVFPGFIPISSLASARDE